MYAFVLASIVVPGRPLHYRFHIDQVVGFQFVQEIGGMYILPPLHSPYVILVHREVEILSSD